MAAHPNINERDPGLMVQYIMSLNSKAKSPVQKLPLAGTFTPKIPAGDDGKGGYLLRVAYKDKGTSDISGLAAEKIIPLRNPAVDPESADIQKGTVLTTTPSRSFSLVGDNSHLGFKNIDLTGINLITVYATAQPRNGSLGGVIELHLDSPNGQLLAQSETIIPKDVDFRSVMAANGGGNRRRHTRTCPTRTGDEGRLGRPRARERAKWYINTAKHEQTEEEFDASGKREMVILVLPEPALAGPLVPVVAVVALVVAEPA